MGRVVYMNENPVCGKALGTVAGDRITLIEVALQFRIEGDGLSCVHFHRHLTAGRNLVDGSQ